MTIKVILKSIKAMEAEKIRNIFGRNVKFFRRHRKLSQSELAEKASISVTFLSNIERGKMFPKVETMSRLTLSLDIEVVELFRTDIVNDNQKEIMGKFSIDIKRTLTAALDEVIAQYMG